MKLIQRHLRQDKPKSDYILAVWADSIYDESNTYIPKWTVIDRKSYKRNKKLFEGWVQLPDEYKISDGIPVQIETRGYVNSVLAYYKEPPIKTHSDLYWGVSNVSYYRKNKDKFKGWIELEMILPPKMEGE